MTPLSILSLVSPGESGVRLLASKPKKKLKPPWQTVLKLDDPRWIWIVEPLREFLRKGKAWSEIHAWARVRGVSSWWLANMLAWLEETGQAVGSKEGWRSS